MTSRRKVPNVDEGVVAEVGRLQVEIPEKLVPDCLGVLDK